MSDLLGEFDAQTPASPPNEAPITSDLYCLECGYNLRGLSGDPVRCPECGNFNPVALIEVPAEEIRRQLKLMETAPTISVVGLALTVLSAIPLAILLIEGEPLTSLTCPLAALLFGLLFWIGGVTRFRRSCLGKPGWLSALLRFQVVAILLVSAIGAGVPSGIALLASRGARSYGPGTALTVFLILSVAIVAAAILGLPRLHRWLKRPMEQLQRAVAVEIARERVRKVMHREKRWMNRR